jgi:putative Mg2+ transporter-C (MgtC) family protein
VSFFTTPFHLMQPAGLSWVEVIFRLALAMLLGLVVGTERSHAHHPAGLRTYMLVAIGSCAIMMTSQQLYVQYNAAFGAMPDPARLPAQIIAGLGFLGGGAILKDGLSVKGLTTAAGIWATGCIGISAGAGYYNITLAGMVALLFVLTVMERVKALFPAVWSDSLDVSLECADTDEMLLTVNHLADKYRAELMTVHVDESAAITPGAVQLTLHLCFGGEKPREDMNQFLFDLGCEPAAREMRALRV